MDQRRHRRMLTRLTRASSLAWMSIGSAAAVLAHSAPTVTPGNVPLSGPIRPTNGSATFAASARDLNGTAEYQFWVESPSGQWRADLAGTAMRAFPDISEPHDPSTSATYTVAPGQATFNPWIECGGATISPTNPAPVSLAGPVEMQVANTDPAGNLIPVQGPSPLHAAHPVGPRAAGNQLRRLQPGGATPSTSCPAKRRPACGR